MPFGELPLRELAMEFLISGAKWTTWTLLNLQVLHPFDLLLALLLLNLLEPLSAFLCQEIVIDEAF